MENLPKPEITKETIKSTKEFKQHQKQSWWQIYFPMLLIIGLFITVIVLMVFATTPAGPNDTHSKWADLIVMVIIVLASIVTLIITAILGISIYYLGTGIKKMPELSNQAKFYVNYGAEKVKEVMDAITQPIIKAGGMVKGVQTAVDNMKKKPTD
jgi:heme/copper-type cytochrome/quinol oxidase subunit 2